jgi:hemerythrin
MLERCRVIDWDDSIIVGIPTVDSDHKEILNKINRFIAAVESRSGIMTIHGSYRDMEACIYRHLGDEERMLSVVGYEEVESHAAIHEKLTDELEQIWNDMLSDPNFLPNEAARKWLEGWLFGHVKSEDFSYRDWIFDRGLEDQAEQAMRR